GAPEGRGRGAMVVPRLRRVPGLRSQVRLTSRLLRLPVGLGNRRQPSLAPGMDPRQRAGFDHPRGKLARQVLARLLIPPVNKMVPAPLLAVPLNPLLRHLLPPTYRPSVEQGVPLGGRSTPRPQMGPSRPVWVVNEMAPGVEQKVL